MEVPETVVTPLQQQYLKKHRQHHLFVAVLPSSWISADSDCLGAVQ